MGVMRNSIRSASAIVASLAVILGCAPSVPAASVPPPVTPVASPSQAPSAQPGSPSASPSPVPSATSGVPAFSNIWIIVLENRDYDRVVGANDLPYISSLIDGYGLAESYFGVARPSQPNYFAMFSGSTHGVTDNDNHDIDAPTLADQIEASGRTWRQYAENVPPGCFKGSSAKGGRDGPGEYVRKHAPAISFTSISSDPDRCAFIEDFTAFRPGDADFALIIPNQCHDAHDCGLPVADAWLAKHVPKIIVSEAFRSDGVLFVTFDEDAGDDPSGGHIATIVVSPLVAAGTRSSVRYDHYSLLRTIEDAWGLDCLAKACDEEPMVDFFATR
jgi:phosphatidylinositol-3-phosphatase